jgi:hypothetical protein
MSASKAARAAAVAQAPVVQPRRKGRSFPASLMRHVYREAAARDTSAAIR